MATVRASLSAIRCRYVPMGCVFTGRGYLDLNRCSLYQILMLSVEYILSFAFGTQPRYA